MEKKKRKILVPIFNRAHYGRLRSVLKEIKERPDLELQIITSTPVAYDNFFINLRHSRPHSWRVSMPWYIRARLLKILERFNKQIIARNDFLMRQILNDGYKIDCRIPLFFDGGSSEAMAKAAGYGLLKIVDKLKKLKPDIIFVNADRFEMMTVALAAACLNIPIAHNEAGDVSGTIDESIRHAITKLAHIHFTSTETSRNRVIQMGENPESVFFTGSPAIDNIKNLNLKSNQSTFPGFNINEPFLFILFHPVTTEPVEKNIEMAKNIFKLIKDLQMPTLLLGTNIDARSKEVGLLLKQFINSDLPYLYHTKHLHPDDFYELLAKASCAIGNSSSFIREGAYFGTPAVIVGTRQYKRERDENIKEVDLDYDNIKTAVKGQINHGRYQPSYMFGNGDTGKRIADILATSKIKIQKEFIDLK